MKENHTYIATNVKFKGGQVLSLELKKDRSPIISEQDSNVYIEIDRQLSERIFNFLDTNLYSTDKPDGIGTKIETFKTKYNDSIIICVSKSRCSILIDDEFDHTALSGDLKEIRDFFKKVYSHFQ